ncbi:excinuclease ABC subunit C [Occallatibacter riparius]|uniref:Excinuclease ABC subunit C n=1 Tax=Occallatibacter riparius TaxID=1002689 RepID=A0A9J7BNL0_9BACT|nr:excinuclease ABC subunit C [Occallatibacter riparius]UWZ84312.1 excinuclease ABC subunit C [Occallatibacter riparius]
MNSAEVMGLSAEFQSVGFDPGAAREILKALPERCAVFALYGEAANAEPYIGRTPNLRGRLERLLIPSPKHPKRLQLAGRVRRIEWRLTGSDFESLLLQFDLLQKVYGAKALERMHLGAPAFVRFLGGNSYPRVTVTNRPSQKEAEWAYGPFASRAVAERFADEALKLFLLRRCTEDLEPDPSHPGCVYSEMKMCLAPCYKGCSDERYAEEAAAVERFLATRGESKLVQLRAARDEASGNLEFESAAALHAQVQKAEAVRALAPELVRPMGQLRAVVMQPPAVGPTAPSAPSPEVAVFMYLNGRLRGPVAFSTLGMRIQNEQSGSSSLFAQPMALEAVAEGRDSRDQAPGTGDKKGREQEDKDPSASLRTGSGTEGQRDRVAARAARTMLEARMEAVLAELEKPMEAPNAVVRQGHLALLKRWYYRPEVKRPGEICFPDDEGAWPVRAMLRAVGRIAAKSLTGAATS